MPGEGAEVLPAGTVTFLLTDIEGSARLWEDHPTEASEMLRRHDALFDDAVGAYDGVVVRPRGEGDSRFAVFARATDAVTAALTFQRALGAESWPFAFRVRAGMHTGETEVRDGDYYGTAVNRCARIRSVAAGGQTLLSRATEELIRGRLPDGASLSSLGEVALRDIAEPEHLFTLVHPDLDHTGGPAAPAAPHNLPAQRTPLIGREDHIHAVQRRFATARVVSLVGAGGCGKTRLAHEVALRAVGEHPDGVWLVELQGTDDPDDVERLVAAAVGLREEDMASASLGVELLRFLKTHDLFILLDNCEHLLDACADLVEQIVGGTEAVRVLATSREPLGLEGETVYRVPSLEVPEQGATDLADIASAPAVQLFLERARASGAPLELTQENASSVATICRRLDGIPLAIELAAPSTNSLAPKQIEERLDEPFRLLVGGKRARAERQRTMRATIEWGYDLLDPAARVLLPRLSVFAGGFTLEAAEGVGVGESLAADDVLPAIGRLLDTSFIQSDTRGERARFRLAETIRQFATERLVTEGSAGTARDRHLSYVRSWVEAIGPDLFTQRLAERLDEITPEIDNVRAAIRWAQERDDAESVASICYELARFWRVRGGTPECVPYLRWSLDRDLTPLWRQRVRYTLGIMLATGGESEPALEHLEAGYEMGDVGDDWTFARIATAVVEARWYGRRQASPGVVEHVLSLARERSDRRSQAWATIASFRAIASEGGDVPASLERTLADPAVLWAASEDPLLDLEVNGFRGLLATLVHAPDRARAPIQRAIEIARSIGAFSSGGAVQDQLGSVLLELHENADAEAAFAEALSVARSGDRPTWLAGALRSWAWVCTDFGRIDEAHAALDEAIAIYEMLGRPLAQASTIRHKGWTAVEQGDLKAARRLLERASTADASLRSPVEDSFAARLALVISIAEGSPSTDLLAEVEEDIRRVSGLNVPTANAMRWIDVARARRRLGDPDGAHAALREMATLMGGSPWGKVPLWFLEERAAQLVDAGQIEDGVRVFASACALRERSGTPLSVGDRLLFAASIEEARDALPADVAERVWAQGAAVPFAQAVIEVTEAVLAEG